jgi:hypothetical protein
MERFVSRIADHLVPIGGNVLSSRTIKVGISSLIKGAIFYYPDFKTTAHDGQRLDSLIQSLILDGKLTNDLKRERRWIGSYTVSEMIHAVYQDALRRGTIDWNITLVKIQSIVLHTALGCRTGDVSASRLDRHALPFLTYQDITMKLVGGNTIEHLTMMVRVRNEKGRK